METKSVAVVGSDGSLNIPWPSTEDGEAVDFDLLLDGYCSGRLQAQSIGCGQSHITRGRRTRELFLNNVLNGIRTVSDDDIFFAIEGESPDWISADVYRDAVAILRAAPDKAQSFTR